jgi:hypothetical protein
MAPLHYVLGRQKKNEEKECHAWQKKNEEVKNIIESWINDKSKLHVAYLWHLIQAKKKEEEAEEQIIILESKMLGRARSGCLKSESVMRREKTKGEIFWWEKL